MGTVAIEQDADIVLLLHRNEYALSRDEAEERDLVGKADLIVAKQRNGLVGEVKLRWVQECGRFMDLATHPDDESEAHTSSEAEC